MNGAEGAPLLDKSAFGLAHPDFAEPPNDGGFDAEHAPTMVLLSIPELVDNSKLLKFLRSLHNVGRLRLLQADFSLSNLAQQLDSQEKVDIVHILAHGDPKAFLKDKDGCLLPPGFFMDAICEHNRRRQRHSVRLLFAASCNQAGDPTMRSLETVVVQEKLDSSRAYILCSEEVDDKLVDEFSVQFYEFLSMAKDVEIAHKYATYKLIPSVPGASAMALGTVKRVFRGGVIKTKLFPDVNSEVEKLRSRSKADILRLQSRVDEVVRQRKQRSRVLVAISFLVVLLMVLGGLTLGGIVPSLACITEPFPQRSTLSDARDGGLSFCSIPMAGCSFLCTPSNPNHTIVTVTLPYTVQYVQVTASPLRPEWNNVAMATVSEVSKAGCHSLSISVDSFSPDDWTLYIGWPSHSSVVSDDVPCN
jgi:hypothetical protein